MKSDSIPRKRGLLSRSSRAEQAKVTCLKSKNLLEVWRVHKTLRVDQLLRKKQKCIGLRMGSKPRIMNQ